MILIDPSKIPLIDGPSKYFDDCPVGLTKEVIDILVKYCGVEFEPVKHGRWLCLRDEDNIGLGLYECSECHNHDIHAKECNVSYCWNCGAKMNLEEVENA